jgi:hypothetical protein
MANQEIKFTFYSRNDSVTNKDYDVYVLIVGNEKIYDIKMYDSKVIPSDSTQSLCGEIRSMDYVFYLQLWIRDKNTNSISNVGILSFSSEIYNQYNQDDLKIHIDINETGGTQSSIIIQPGHPLRNQNK